MKSAFEVSNVIIKNINCLSCKGLNKYKEDKYILAVLKTFEKD